MSEFTVSLSDHDLLIRIDEKISGLVSRAIATEKITTDHEHRIAELEKISARLPTHEQRLAAIEGARAEAAGAARASQSWRAALMPVAKWILAAIISLTLYFGRDIFTILKGH